MKHMVKGISIDIPGSARCIMKAFEERGYEIFIVGGCVRDSILGRLVNDWDMCTSAHPDQMIKVCDDYGFKHIPTGLKHGTITIIMESISYEITTYRLDGDYSDGRHPDKVAFTSSLEEDMSRRDFTINALAYNEKSKLIDYFEGFKDIKDKIIRCVGNPEERFREDNLRRLRAIRFASQLCFDIEEETNLQLMKNQDGLLSLSVERIRDELVKILLCDNASFGINELMKLGMMKYIIPELEVCKGFEQKNKHHDKDVFEHTLSVMNNIPPRLELRLSALLHDIGKPVCMNLDETSQGHFLGHEIAGAEMAEKILKRLRFDNKTIDKVRTLIRFHMDRYDKIKTSAVKRFINRVGTDNLEDLFELQAADIKGSSPEYQNTDKVVYLRERCHIIISEKQPLKTGDLDISGRDLINLGFKPGPGFGEALKYLLELVLDDPELNTKEQLMGLLKEKYNI